MCMVGSVNPIQLQAVEVVFVHDIGPRVITQLEMVVDRRANCAEFADCLAHNLKIMQRRWGLNS